MTEQQISKMIMDWRIERGTPGVPFPLQHNQHWDLVRRISTLIKISQADAATDEVKQIVFEGIQPS